MRTKTYSVQVSWTVEAIVSIKAMSVEEAVDLATYAETLPRGDYVSDSFKAKIVE